MADTVNIHQAKTHLSRLVERVEAGEEHRSPFHRMLVAQSQRLDAIIVTRDPSYEAYRVDVLPA